MDIVKVSALALATAIGTSQAFGQSHEPDWRVAGSTGNNVILYSVPGIVREPDGLVRVWTEELNLKASQQAANTAASKPNRRFMDAVAGRIARYYTPPFLVAGIDDSCKSSADKSCVVNLGMSITMTEEVADENLVRVEGQTLYALDCKNKRARALQVVVFTGGSPSSANGPSGWMYAPPQSVLEGLITIVCNPAVAAVDNTPLKRRTRAAPPMRQAQPY